MYRGLVTLIALAVGVLVTLDELGYYVSHPRNDHSLTVVLAALGVGLALVAFRQLQMNK